MSKVIKVRIVGSTIQISAPYDAELIEDIKVLTRQYKWSDPYWLVQLHDPNQKEDERTNLEYILDIATECADRNGWEFLDLTNISPEEEVRIFEERQQNQLSHIKEILNQIPPGFMRLVRWHDSSLDLQLAGYLGEDKYDLFMELYDTSNKADKIRILRPGDRIKSGFIFNIPYDDEVLKILGKRRTEYLEYVELEPVKQFDNQVVHFLGDSKLFYLKGAEISKPGDKTLWFGAPLSLSDVSDSNLSTNTWRITEFNGRLYQVADVQEFVYAWINASPYTFSYFGGSFAIINSLGDNYFQESLDIFHLHGWIADHLEFLKQIPPKCSNQGHRYNVRYYSHVSELFIRKGYADQAYEDFINIKKQELVKDTILKARETAIHDFRQLLEIHTKQELLEKYSNECQLKKAWSKKQLIEVICTYDRAIKDLGIPSL